MVVALVWTSLTEISRVLGLRQISERLTPIYVSLTCGSTSAYGFKEQLNILIKQTSTEDC